VVCCLYGVQFLWRAVWFAFCRCPVLMVCCLYDAVLVVCCLYDVQSLWCALCTVCSPYGVLFLLLTGGRLMKKSGIELLLKVCGI
jgi:hypothetical protein